ncbi:DUF3006 domain-containing protein [Neobacillus sp. PS3-34]|uniref:DUF3006 domain-containing protein n=1 Tax=Neobacillus sp. PS3-34 TaxID=3070678 RepID=UPI0027E14E02|nr:DUF3006 domain-containing protein [Neobacillus sp. PS3-34]WML48409.1 DUF3006 domain-containing protein [Neobacillus sp. PS3-34]
MKSNKFTVDRFEEEKAVLLQRDDETIEKIVAKKLLGTSVSEGDILLITFSDNGNVEKSELLKEETEQAREQANKLLEKLKNN